MRECGAVDAGPGAGRVGGCGGGEEVEGAEGEGCGVEVLDVGLEEGGPGAGGGHGAEEAGRRYDGGLNGLW